jgi:hypothetical protein
MQLRYLGDSHDYIELFLLRHFHGILHCRLGVNWYLTEPEDNDDGEQRHYLNEPEWERLDRELLHKLRAFQKRENRTFAVFESAGVLPAGTLYYKSKVSPRGRRQLWHECAMESLKLADLIFLDQDNGFQVNSMTARTEPKYALYEEAVEYLKLGKIIVAIQFARQCKPIQRGNEVRDKLLLSVGSSRICRIVRGRVAPNILFLVASTPALAGEVGSALETFEAKSPILRGRRRVELIE